MAARGALVAFRHGSFPRFSARTQLIGKVGSGSTPAVWWPTHGYPNFGFHPLASLSGLYRMAKRQQSLGRLQTAVHTLALVMHDLEEEVFWFAILGNVHHPRLIVRSRYWELGDVSMITGWSIVTRHCHSFLFMRTNRDISLLFLRQEEKDASSRRIRMEPLNCWRPKCAPEGSSTQVGRSPQVWA
jgi:hypothetical protein